MKLYYGKRRNKPLLAKQGRSHKLVIQEREYASLADMQRGMALLRRYWSERIGSRHFSCFTNGVSANGVPKVYFCRDFSDFEIVEAGYDPLAFYTDKRA